MKKLLILSTLISSMAFAETLETVKTTKMDVSARVIDALKVEVINHINLGTIIKGNEATAEGKYKVSGEEGENYTVTIPELKKNNRGKINLIHETSPKKKLIARVVNEENKMSIGENGNEHKISVKTKVPEKIESGKYSAQLTLSVRYDG